MMAKVLWTLIGSNPLKSYQQAAEIVDDAIATAIHLSRCAVSRLLGVLSGALVFQQDMFVDLPVKVDSVCPRETTTFDRQNLRR